MWQTAQYLKAKGELIFNPKEQDRKSSSEFLIILLNSIEKWSSIIIDNTNNN
jgi:hypothetical protein